MEKKSKKEILSEAKQKFKMLSEYSFYQERQSVPEYVNPEDEDDLLLGVDELSEEDDTEDIDSAAADVEADLGLDAEAPGEGGEEGGFGDEPAPEGEPAPEEGGFGDEPAMDEPAMDEPAMEEPVEDEVEVDVTSIVKGSEEAKDSADRASQNTEKLLQKLNDLESRVQTMDRMGKQIDDLEQEIVKRNPTPNEKLDMRSMDSFPYSVKLTDYWKDETNADISGEERERKEYTLTQDDIDNDYSETDIKKSFKVGKDNPFEEENI